MHAYEHQANSTRTAQLQTYSIFCWSLTHGIEQLQVFWLVIDVAMQWVRHQLFFPLLPPSRVIRILFSDPFKRHNVAHKFSWHCMHSPNLAVVLYHSTPRRMQMQCNMTNPSSNNLPPRYSTTEIAVCSCLEWLCRGLHFKNGDLFRSAGQFGILQHSTGITRIR